MSVTGQFSLEPRPWALCAASPQCPTPGGTPCRCLADFLTKDAEDDPQGTAQLLAFRESAEVVGTARPNLEQALRNLLGVATATEAALRELASFIRRRQIVAARGQVARVEARYADDGPYDRRRHLHTPRWLPLPAISMIMTLLVSLFEVWFLGQFFRYLTGVGGSPSSVHYWLSYLPGVGLAVLLYWSGHLLAEPVAVWRRRRAGWTDTGRPRPEWWIPLTLAGAVLATIGTVAWARADFLSRTNSLADELAGVSAGGGGGGRFLSVVAVVLLVMLSASTIVMKVAIYNPDAQSATEAAIELATTEEEYRQLRAAAEYALTAHQDAWIHLRGLVWATYSEIDDLWSMAGLRFPDLLPPVAQRPEPEPPDAEISISLLRHTPRTPPAFGYLLHAAHTLGPCSPAPAAERLEHLVALADSQWQERILPATGDPATDDWHLFSTLDVLTSHRNRPGRTVGRGAYQWVLTFEDEPELGELVEHCQGRLALSGLDPVPVGELRLTLAQLAFTDDIDAAYVDEAVANARRALADVESFTLLLGPPTGSPDAVRLTAEPREALLALNDRVLDAGPAGTPDMSDVDVYDPHVDIAYANRTLDARPVVEVVAALRELPRVEVGVREIALVKLPEQSGDHRRGVIHHEVVARIPLGRVFG
ncbi:2'-5' RNA ligase family protein [Parafrankia sp. FMc2]|uniref:2'-5' RNA ligase family protein n=1 Tax=Parafrankia sp. FMc2 TaxID=3233196 RepID=UPI0034D509C2